MWKDMGLELVDEGYGVVERLGAEDGFELRARFGESFIDGVMHGELGVNKGAEKAEGGAGAVEGVENAELFLERVESDSVSSAPCMDL